MSAFPSPVVASTLSQSKPLRGVPEVTDVTYDLWLLRITLRFEHHDGPAYLEFPDTAGFRVLDEGDLTEFWSVTPRPDGWLWRIDQGGWLDLERTRPSFVTGIAQAPAEYLVVGLNDCVSILAGSEPRVVQP